MSTYTLYGAPISMYTGKARAYLRYKNIPFNEVLSTYRVYKKVILPNTGVRFIPVLKTPSNEYIQDTANIIDFLEKAYPKNSVFPSAPKQLLVAKLFEWFGDEWVLLPAMHYRWNVGDDDYIYQQFGQTVFPNLPRFLQKFIGKKVGIKFRGFVPKIGITPSIVPALEDWFEKELLPQLDCHFAEHNYLLGNKASIGDFGLIGPLSAHLYTDPTPKAIMDSIAPNVVRWITRMNETPEAVGEWIADDKIPETLTPILHTLCQDFLTHMLKTPEAVAYWKGENRDIAIPRAISETSFTLGNATGKRLVTPFSQWKLQRVLSSLSEIDADRTAQSTFLKSINGEGLLDVKIDAPVKREHNVLVWI
ncbi:glutathione S-transferase [Thalassotalea euphylliae]|uniref:glutathione S-transferase n=1 Tax=Thalassotalea euphylliae TaxID=1655234 RepID=UPI003633A0BF